MKFILLTFTFLFSIQSFASTACVIEVNNISDISSQPDSYPYYLNIGIKGYGPDHPEQTVEGNQILKTETGFVVIHKSERSAKMFAAGLIGLLQQDGFNSEVINCQ